MTRIASSQKIDLSVSGQPLDRFFLEGIGSCHAYLTLREDWRDHARLVQREIGFKSVRAHGIFHDLVGIVPALGSSGYNFQNLDKIYDFWLAQRLKPYVELSFMPEKLASGSQTCFAYRANVTPPEDMQQWSALIQAFLTHLIQRYGLAEVQSWNFEVWNEPDLGYFWGGDQQDYFALYEASARAVKAVHPGLRVGGPATSKSLWVPELLDFCLRSGAPLDFISTHHYCADAALEMGKFTEDIRWRGQKAMQKDVLRVVQDVRQSALPNLPVHYTEWNVSPIHEDRFGKDSEFTAAFVLQTIKDVAGLAKKYMLWAISDIFEESGPGTAPFSGKYGLVSMHGIKKPVFHAFHFLSQLFDENLPAGDSCYLTRSASGDLRLLSWNFNEPQAVDFTGGDYAFSEQEKEETFTLTGMAGRCRVRGWQVNREDGNAYRAWQEIGSPQYLHADAVEMLKQRAEPVLFIDQVEDCTGSLRLQHILAANGLVFYDIEQL